MVLTVSSNQNDPPGYPPGRPLIKLLLLVTRCPAELLVLVLPDFLPALFDNTGHLLSSFLITGGTR
jgi:hypothetical protein